MIKKYTNEIVSEVKENKIGPSNTTLNSILNYSKSLEVKKLKKEKVLFHLN